MPLGPGSRSFWHPRKNSETPYSPTQLLRLCWVDTRGVQSSALKQSLNPFRYSWFQLGSFISTTLGRRIECLTLLQQQLVLAGEKSALRWQFRRSVQKPTSVSRESFTQSNTTSPTLLGDKGVLSALWNRDSTVYSKPPSMEGETSINVKITSRPQAWYEEQSLTPLPAAPPQLSQTLVLMYTTSVQRAERIQSRIALLLRRHRPICKTWSRRLYQSI